jgi:hypothetical protein
MGGALHAELLGYFPKFWQARSFRPFVAWSKNGENLRENRIGTPRARCLACREGRQRNKDIEGRKTMYKGNNSFRTTLAALVCTLVVSTTSLATVVGPAVTATDGATVSARTIA